MKVSFARFSPTLTFIGRKLGIDAHYFAKNSFIVLVGHAISILKGVVTGYLVARFFAQETYGSYQFILSIVSMLSLFTVPGLAHSVTRAWARGDSFSYKKITTYQLRVCGIGSLLLIGCIPFLPYYNRQELWPLFLTAAILFPLPPIAMVRFGGFTVGKAQFGVALKASIIWSVIVMIVTLGIIFLAPSATLLLLASMSIPSLVYLFMSRTIRPPQEAGRDRTKQIVRYAWQLSLATIPIEVVWYVDKLLISHFFGLSQLATFSVAMLIPEQVKLLMKQFLPVTFSRQAQGEDTMERRMKILKVGSLGAGILAISIVLYIAVTPFLMPILFPQYDARMVSILTSIAAVTLLNVPGSFFAQYMEAQGMIRQVRLSNWIAAGTFAVALVSLVPTFGLIGAVVARGIFRLTYMITSIWFAFYAPLHKKA